jgi:recombinational DNA repair ATPase RecF
MRQRNALLKSIRDGEAKREDLDYWDQSFAEKANIYGLYRKRWYHFIHENISRISLFLDRYTIRCLYESKYLHEEDPEEYIFAYLMENRERDIITGHTHIGPHLDDFSFRVSLETPRHPEWDEGSRLLDNPALHQDDET